MKEALRILIDGARRDPINGAVMPLVGAGILFALWYYGVLPWDVIHAVICHDIC